MAFVLDFILATVLGHGLSRKLCGQNPRLLLSVCCRYGVSLFAPLWRRRGRLAPGVGAALGTVRGPALAGCPSRTRKHVTVGAGLPARSDHAENSGTV